MDPQELVRALLGMGLTQTEIAARTGMPQPTVSKVARGAVRDVMSHSYRQLKALHDELTEADSEVRRCGAHAAPAAASQGAAHG